MLLSATRYLIPALGAVILLRCAAFLLTAHRTAEVWGWLELGNGTRVELAHWENIVGRARSADVVLPYKSVSRTHAALMRDSAGRWTVQDLSSKAGVKLRGKALDGPAPVRTGDALAFGGAKCVFHAATAREERDRAQARRDGRAGLHSTVSVLLLTAFVVLVAAQHLLTGARASVAAAFGGLLALLWGSYAVTRALHRTGFEVETLAFMLTSVGFGVCATSDPGALWKELALLAAGLVLYFLIGTYLRDLGRARKLSVPMAAAGIALLLVNLLTAKSIFGAKNWLEVAGISFQPSEFVKICFIFAGAATLDRLFTRRNLILFVGFAAATVLCLAAMSDFGTAAVFFVTYIVIAFMRSGSFATVVLSLAGAGFGAFLAVTARPYILRRFAAWGNAWADPSGGGYQQTRTMAAAASGGLFGLGGGQGRLYKIFAADTDMVFGIVCEELGLVTAVLCVLAVLLLALFAVRAAGSARSTFTAIAACAAVTVMLTQLALNVFGSADLLPFTGVTFPFVSRGGSSLIATWGLLAFVKAADARQDASFTVPAPPPPARRRGRGKEEEA